MGQIKQPKAINSDAYQHLKLLIDPRNKIVDLYVQGRWLVAELRSGVRFMVKNEDFKGREIPT